MEILMDKYDMDYYNRNIKEHINIDDDDEDVGDEDD